MTNKNENIKVVAPDKWMAGWDNYFKKMMEQPDEALVDTSAHFHPVIILSSKINGKCDNWNALDLGSGHGQYALHLAKLGCNVDAIDALDSAVAITKRRAKILNLSDKINAMKKDIDGWEIKEESYDIILAIQCLQYLFDRAVPRLKELASAVKPGGFLVYTGNIPPHFETDPPMHFIYPEELKEIFKDWIYHNFGSDERLLRPNDLRGYVYLCVQKPEKKE